MILDLVLFLCVVMSQLKFLNLFKRAKANIIAMVHLQALPGSPMNVLPLETIRNKALKEAEIYLDQGVDAVMIENMHDVPYLKNHEMGPEVVASMASVATSLRQKFTDVPLGIQILTCANREALAVAKCTGLNFIRAEGFVFSHVGDEGWIDSSAGSLLRYRKNIHAEDILVFTDIKKKHSSHAVTSDVTLSESACAAEFFLSDGVIITGSETGVAPDEAQLREVQGQVDLPVLVGSGITEDKVSDFLRSSAMVIGSHFKEQGSWKRDVDAGRVKSFMEKINALRGSS